MPKWKGYKPGSKAALEAAARYKPPPTIKEPGEEPKITERPVTERAITPKVTAPERPAGVAFKPPAGLEKPKLPAGKREVTSEGYIRITQSLGGGKSQMSVWRKTDTGYIQIAGPGGQAFIPTTPSTQLREALAEIRDLSGRTQFERAIELQLIPPESQYVPGTGKGWGYLTPQQVKEKLADKEELAAVKRGYVFVGDGQWIAKKDYYALPVEDRAFIQEKGYAEWRAAYDKAMAAVEPYKRKTPSIREEGAIAGVPFERYKPAPDTYNLVGAIKGGYLKEVQKLFPPETITAAQEIIKAEETVATKEVARYTGDKWWYYDPEYGPRVILEEERKKVEAGDPNAKITKYRPALVLAADPEWQTLKDRPASDPERQAYLEEWGKKVFDTVSFAALAATPWSLGGISAVGMKALPHIFSGVTKAGSFIVTGGTSLAKAPVLSSIPRVATQLVVGVTKLAVAPAPPAVLTAHAIDEKNARDLQTSWQAFDALPMADKDKWAKQAGYPGYDKLTDPQKAVTLLHYAAPSEKTLDSWLVGIGASVDKLTETANKGSTWLDEHAPAPAIIPAKVAEGTLLGAAEGVHYVAALPLIAAGMADKTPRGEAKAFAGQVATGMAEFFAAIPALWIANPALQTGRLTGLFILSPKALIKLGKGFGYTINPAKIKGFGRAISIEFSTLRVPKLGEATQADMLKLGKQIVKQLAEGKPAATAKLGNFTVKVRNVPYQVVKPGRYWHFSTDITKFPAGKPINLGAKRLHLSPQAAKRFAVTSAFGKPMRRPGQIELVVSEKYQPELYKALGKGEIEIETAVRNRTLDYVSKRTEFDMELGNYPVHQYILRGDYVTPKTLKVSPAEHARIQALVAQEVALDMTLGWHGRMQRLKQMLAKDPRIKKIEDEIARLEAEAPELIGKDGAVLRQRTPYPHPEVGGLVRPRVTAVVKRADGAVLLVMDKTETAYGLPGGQIDPKWLPGKLGFTPKGHGKRYLTLAGSAHGQVKSETGIGLASTKPKGIYLGKVNRHAMSGSYVFEAKPDTVVIDRLKYQKGKVPELKDAIWYDGTTRIKVYPAAYDILKGMGYNVKNVKITRAIPELLKARDTAYGSRLKTGKAVDLKAYNQVEIKALQRAKAKLTSGRAPELADYFTAEPDWRAITELIMGRRQAVKVSKGRITPDAIKSLDKTPELKTAEVARLIEKQKQGKALTEAELRQYQRAVDRAFAKQRAKLQDAFDRAYDYARRNYPHEYSRAYAYYLRAIVAGLGQYRTPVAREDYVRAALAKSRSPIATRLEAYKPEPYKPPTPYERPEPLYIPTKYAPSKYEAPPPSPPYKPVLPYKPPPPYEPPPYKPEPRKLPEPEPLPRLVPRIAREVKKERKVEERPGSMGWKQGNWWVKVVPPFRGEKPTVSYSKAPPEGAKILKGKPLETFFTRGGKVPASVKMQMGAFTVSVSPSGVPRLKFRRRL